MGTAARPATLPSSGTSSRLCATPPVLRWCGIANIGGGSRRSLNDAVEIVGELLGHVRILRRPDAAGDVRDTAADTSVAAAAFGYRPHTSLRDGLAAMVATERVSKGALR